jgi:hypothetical protein
MEHPTMVAAIGKSVRMSNLRILPENSRIARNLQYLIRPDPAVEITVFAEEGVRLE